MPYENTNCAAELCCTPKQQTIAEDLRRASNMLSDALNALSRLRGVLYGNEPEQRNEPPMAYCMADEAKQLAEKAEIILKQIDSITNGLA